MVMEQVLKAIDARDEDTFADLLAPDCEFVAPGFTARGPSEAWGWMKAFLDGFPDIRHSIKSSVSSGSTEAVEIEIVGTHTEPLASPQGSIPATGRSMTIAAADFVETDSEGRVRSYRIYFDQMGFMAQLGLV